MNRLTRFVATILLATLFTCAQVKANEAEVDLVLDKVEANLFVNRDLADKLVSHAENLLEGKSYPSQQARLLNLQAHLHIMQFDLNNAYALAVEAQKLAEQADNKLQVAEAIRKQGIVNFLLDFDADAIDLLTESLSLHQAIDSEFVLNNLQAIGNVYAKNDTWADSLLEIGELLVEKAVIEKDAYFEEQGYSFIASGLIKKGEYAQASLTAKQALKALGNESLILRYYVALAELKLQNYASALEYIDAQLDVVKKNYSPLRDISSNLLKAEILLLDGQPAQSQQLLEYALNKANEIDFANYQKDALKQMADFYQASGQTQPALDYLKQYTALKEKDFNAKQAKQLAFSRARLELEQKNQRITELEFSRQLSEQQNSYQLYFIVLSILVIALLVTLYWRSSIQKRMLRAYSDELKQATEAKSQFLAKMSHEIRTPVNAIIGLTKLTRKSELAREQQDTNLQQIEESSHTLLGVINDILDFSKIEAGKLQIEVSTFELDKLIHQAIRLQAIKAQEKDLELVEYIARDVPLVIKGDALRVQQVLNNLISNAVKFTEKGVVSVSVNKKYSESNVLLEFSIKDTGIGLSEEQKGRLFRSFTQADESTTRQYGGTGLGLAICKQLVELMGGKIWVESKPNQGSTFYFTIKVGEAKDVKVPAVFSTSQLSALRVLVVDDVDLSRQAAAQALLRVNINPDIVESGFQAIQKIRLAVEEKAPYELVILDWKMPDIDGIEVASIINQEFSHIKPKIIMLSAHDIDYLQELGKPLGIERYMEKPINTSDLLNNILEITNLSHADVDKAKRTIASVPDLSGINILLVEDNELNRKVAKGFLAETQCNVTVAENGQEAVTMLTNTPSRFDLILMDIQMPVMDGLEATQIIREQFNLTLPVIAMTANAMKGDIDKSIAVGMDEHISKPVDPEHLYDVLDAKLRGRASQVHADTDENTGKADADLAALLVVDKQKAIKRLRGFDALYADLLNDFVAMESKLGELQTAIDNQNVESARILVHSYRSALSYIGAYALSSLATEIEAELIAAEGEIDKPLRLSLEKLLQAIRQITEQSKTSGS